MLRAKELVGDEPFATVLPDDVIDAEVPCVRQLIDIYEAFNGPVLAVMEVSPDQISSYGCIDAEPVEYNGSSDRVFRVKDMVEKPKREDAPSNLAIIGRYILTPDIFGAVENITPGAGGETAVDRRHPAVAEEQACVRLQVRGQAVRRGRQTGLPAGERRAGFEAGRSGWPVPGISAKLAIVTPSLFDLPLRLGDAVSLAALVFEFAEGRQINDEVRGRIAGRAAAVSFQAMRPFVGSLERDPVHPSAYFCCVDGVDRQPLLLRIALASAPSSGLFPKAILIGRTHLDKRELVINAVPFGPDDREQIQTFSEKLNPAFLPKPFGTKPVIRLMGEAPGIDFFAAADALRVLLKSTGQNLACFAAAPGADLPAFYYETVWAMIRVGWREGYCMQAEPNTADEARGGSPVHATGRAIVGTCGGFPIRA